MAQRKPKANLDANPHLDPNRRAHADLPNPNARLDLIAEGMGALMAALAIELNQCRDLKPGQIPERSGF